jgi:hypothetical protein
MVILFFQKLSPKFNAIMCFQSCIELLMVAHQNLVIFLSLFGRNPSEMLILSKAIKCVNNNIRWEDTNILSK